MKNIACAVALSLGCIVSQAQTINPEFYKNGAKAHFLVSAGLGSTCMLTSSYSGLTESQCFIAAVSLGVIEEIKDSMQPGNTFSRNDLFWDILGSYVGVKAGGLVISPNKVSYKMQF